MKFYGVALLIFLCFVPPGGSAQMARPAINYHLLKKIMIGGEGTWDYPALDQSSRRLYVSHQTEVAVVNVDSGEVTGRINNLDGVHGIAPVPELGKGFISEGKADSVSIFDLKTLALVGKIKTGKGPDAIIYDPATRRLFTSNGDSADMTAIDAATGNVVGTIPVGGDPEAIVSDGKGLLWVDIADKNEVINLDSKRLVVKNRWPIDGCQEPKSLALDNKHRLLFVGCRNHVMAVVNADNGRLVNKLPIGDHVDATIFDPATGMIFNSNGDGTITVIQEDSPNRFHVAETVTTQRGAKTMAFDRKTKRLFLPVAELQSTAAGANGKKPVETPVSGTFVVLVFGR